MPTMDYEGQAQRVLAHVAESNDIHPTNKELVRSYHQHMLLSGISPVQRQKPLAHLKIIVDDADKISFHDLDKDDMLC